MERWKLQEYNEWWATGAVPKALLKEYRRPMYNEIASYLKKRQIISLVGLRRVGKTVMLYQLIDHLLKETDREKILFFSFDEETAEIGDVLESYREVILKKSWRNAGKLFVFLDEIQKVKGWQNTLKKYYDLYPNIKFVISGSAGLILEKKTKETLAGRIYRFLLGPLNFKEFLFFKGFNKIDFKKLSPVDLKKVRFKSFDKIHKEVFIYEKELKLLFNDYLARGGFPEIVNEDLVTVKRYINDSVVEKIVYRDVPEEFKIEEPSFLVVLLKIVANSPGMLLEYTSLAKDFNKDRKTISNYFFYLQKSFLVSILANYRSSHRASARKLKKIYLTEIGIVNALLEKELSDKMLGKVVENLIINRLGIKFFARNGFDIDGVIIDGTTIPIEVKYQERISSADLKGIISFLKKFKRNTGIIVTKNLLKEEKVNGLKLIYVPAWLMLLST